MFVTATATLFSAVAATHVRAPPVPQWSRNLIASFTYFMESYVAILPSQIYAEFVSAENPLPVLGEACPLRGAGEKLWLCCVVQTRNNSSHPLLFRFCPVVVKQLSSY